MNLEDRELDALLRDVPVPPGLHDELKQIPDEFEPVRLHTSSIGSWQLVAAIAIAASLIGIACWLVWPEMKPGKLEIAQQNVVEHPPAQVGNEIDWLSEQIAELAWELESREQLAKLSELRQAESMGAVALQKPAERDALTMYLSSEAASTWGAGNDFVEAEMQQIIERYPDTAGASRAQEFLKQSTEL